MQTTGDARDSGDGIEYVSDQMRYTCIHRNATTAYLIIPALRLDSRGVNTLSWSNNALLKQANLEAFESGP